MTMHVKQLTAALLAAAIAAPAVAGPLEDQLFAAILDGTPWRVKELIREGVDVNARNAAGTMALDDAIEGWAYCAGDQGCEAAYDEIIKALQDAGARTDP